MWVVKARNIDFAPSTTDAVKVLDRNDRRAGAVIQNRSTTDLLVLQFGAPTAGYDGIHLLPLETYHITTINPWFDEVFAFGPANADKAVEFTFEYRT